jgi:hypothetical protein
MKKEFVVNVKGVKILVCELEEGDRCSNKTIFTSSNNPLTPDDQNDVSESLHLSRRGGERLSTSDLLNRNYYTIVTYGFNMNFLTI